MFWLMSMVVTVVLTFGTLIKFYKKNLFLTLDFTFCIKNTIKVKKIRKNTMFDKISNISKFYFFLPLYLTKIYQKYHKNDVVLVFLIYFYLLSIFSNFFNLNSIFNTKCQI